MPSQIKETAVLELTEELKTSANVVVTEYQGMKAEEFNELRANLRPLGAKYKVVKNRLAKIAFKNAGLDALNDSMKGPSAIAYQAKDASALARVLSDFGSKHQTFRVKSGRVFEMVVDGKSLKAIASLPSREVLLATLLARMNGPLQKFVSTLNEPIRALSASLSAVAKKKEATPAA